MIKIGATELINFNNYYYLWGQCVESNQGTCNGEVVRMYLSMETNKASLKSQTGDDGVVTEPKEELEAH